jgi:hypothetical protein
VSDLLPASTTVSDLCTAALKDSGAIGVGQTPLAEDLQDAWARLQWMLQQWERKRWLVYHLVDLAKVSTGAVNYSVGPGGDFDTGPGTMRPNRLEAAFLRQIQNASPPNQVDFPLEILQSYEDYAKISLKQLKSWPGFVFLDTAWNLANLFVYPVPQATIYEVHIIIRAALPVSFTTQADKFNIPYEYYEAIVTNLAIRLRPKYGLGSFPGDELPARAKEALATLRGSNTQIARLVVPPEVIRPGLYNIFSDRFY